MASNCDVRDCTTGIKKRKIDSSSSEPIENDIKMDISSFSEKFYNSSSVSEEILPMNGIASLSTEQVLTGGDSGFSEIEMNTSVEEANVDHLPSFDDAHLEAPVPGSSNFNSSMDVREEFIDNDDMSSTISELSGISDLSGQDWKPTAGPMSWVQKQMANGTNPRELLSQLVQDDATMSSLPPGMDDFTLWKIIVSMLSEPPRRKKLPNVNTLEDVVNLIRTCKNIVVLTGAGVSVSSGIPDFRSRNGIYSRLAVDFPDLPDPQAMFDIQYFNRDPRPFFKFAREIYPGQFKPSPCHRFIRALEAHGKLLRNYTQNIDTLEQVTGIEKVIQCHGSFATATCTKCKKKVLADEIREDIFAQRIPSCTTCCKDNPPENVDGSDYTGIVSRGIMKPDIVFFGEGLPEDFHEAMAEDKDKCDLLIVIGSSLKVRPVALIPSSIPAEIPQVLINLEPLSHLNFDVELLGESDIVIDHLCRLLGEDWVDVCWRETQLVQTQELLPETPENSATQKMESEAETLTNQINSQTEIFVGKINNFRYGHTIVEQEVKTDCNENSRKRGLASSDSAESDSKRLKLNDEKTNVITQSLRDVRVCSVDSMMDSGEGESVCSESCGFRDLKHASPSLIKERQISMDSTRDSGIGESSKEVEGQKSRRGTNEEDEDDENGDEDDDEDDDGTCWQPKHRVPISKRLPENTYYFIQPNRYVFQGAEVYSTTTRLRREEPQSRESDDLDSNSDSELSEFLDQI